MVKTCREISLLRSAAAAAIAGIALIGSGGAGNAEIGVAAAVNVDARGRPPGGGQRLITLGQNVVFREEITTDERGLVQILLLDGTTFTVGPNSQLFIDEFVYNPTTGDAKVVATVTKGAFRFIGGQTSRRVGGATINTPVGVIGIRGAMVEGRVGASCGSSTAAGPTFSLDCGAETLFSMIFGDEVLFNGRDGSSSRIFQPGYTMTIAGFGGNLDTNVRPRTREDAATFQAALTSQEGQSGGAAEQPTDTTVEDSEVSEVNSELPAIGPIPDFRDVDTSDALDSVTQEELREQAVQKQPEPEPEDPTAAARVFTAPEEYIVYGERVTLAGERGLVGSTPDSDRIVTLVKEGGRLISDEAGINLPDFTGPQGDGGLIALAVFDGLSPAGPATGTAYAGVGDFVAYMLGVNGDPTAPFYTITGTPTPASKLRSLNTGTDLREYTLTQDPIRPSPVPFFAQDLYGTISNYSSTNFFIIESNTAAYHQPGEISYDARAFQSWISIDGQGAQQKSVVFMYAPTVFLDPHSGTNAGMDGGRRGSFRHAAHSGPANLRGSLATISGPNGIDFFGPDLNHFMLGANESPPDGFYDVILRDGYTGNPQDGYLGTGGPFSTHHIADLVAKVTQASLSRTSRTVFGFMSGFGESSGEGPGAPYLLASGEAPSFTMFTNPEFNYVGAAAEVYDVFDQSPVAAGYFLDFNSGTFVDDDRFAIRTGNNNGDTRMFTDGGQDVVNKIGDYPGSYMVSGRAAPLPGYTHCNACNFLDWGWWGTRVLVEGDGSEFLGDRRDFVHMGTWVAGDITNPADLPTNVIANYSGTALGNVARQTSQGVAQYIARGDMNMSFDFNSRAGNMQISNFDGMNLISEIAETSNSVQALFGGPLAGSGVQGSVHGAFVNDGPNVAAGVIGNFSVLGSGVSATGTVAGARVD